MPHLDPFSRTASAPAANATTVVSVTPVAVERDSRTYKQAASLTALGYRSIVVEGIGSRRNRSDLPFTLISPPQTNGDESGIASSSPAPNIEQTRPGWLRQCWHSIREKRRGSAVRAGVFLVLFSSYLRRYLIRPLRHLPGADLYILHEYSTYPAVRLRAALYRVPIIYDAHDFYSGIEPEQKCVSLDKRWLASVHRYIERSCIRGAPAVLTVSNGVANLLRERFDTDAVVLRNLHDPRLDRSDAADLRTRLGLASDAFVLVTVGNRKCGQFLDPAIEAIARLPHHVHLVFVGAGYEDVCSNHARRTSNQRVHTAGVLALDEIVPAIRGADASLVLYYPHSDNYRAALPNGLFQSIAAELPLFYPDLPEITALLRAWSAGLPINPADTTSIVSAVIRLMDDPEAAGSLDQRRKLARAHEWANEEAIFASIVETALQSGDMQHPSLQRKTLE